MTPDIIDKLELIQCRMLVAELCRRSKHSRAWFYRVLRGEVGCLAELPLIDELLQNSEPTSPIAHLRELARPRADQAALARLAGVSRQTISLWESEAAPSEERLARVRSLLRVNA